MRYSINLLMNLVIIAVNTGFAINFFVRTQWLGIFNGTCAIAMTWFTVREFRRHRRSQRRKEAIKLLNEALKNV